MRWLVGVGWLALAWPVWAAEPLALDAAIEEALRTNPAVREAAEEVEKSGGDVRAAAGEFDPVLVADGGWNRILSRQRFGQFPDPFDILTDGWDAGLSLRGTAPTGTSATFSARFEESTSTIQLNEDDALLGQLFGDDTVQKTFQPTFRVEIGQELLRGIRLASGMQRVRQAGEGRQLAELRYAAARQQAIADVSRLYWAWVYRAQVARIEAEGVRTAEEALRVGIARVDAGRAAPVERTRLEAALVQSQVEALNADNEAARARDELLVALGRRPGAVLDPVTEPGDAPEVPLDMDRAMAAAQEGSLDIAVAQAQVEIAEQALRDARHAMLPQLTASVNAGLRGFDDTSWADAFALGDSLLPNVGVRGTFSMPLGNRAAAGAQQRASGEVARAKVAKERVEAQVLSQVAAQVRTLTSARTQVTLADANLRLAKETLAAEEARYDAGRALLQDVLEARAEVERLEAEAVRARTDFRVAAVEAQRLVGMLE